jgi:hypothetical protein
VRQAFVVTEYVVVVPVVVVPVVVVPVVVVPVVVVLGVVVPVVVVLVVVVPGLAVSNRESSEPPSFLLLASEVELDVARETAPPSLPSSWVFVTVEPSRSAPSDEALTAEAL